MALVLIVYHSQQEGNTEALAEAIAEGCRRVPGIEVRLINTNQTRPDADAVEPADALALGSPDYFTYMAGGLKQFFDDMLIAAWDGRNVQEKPCLAFMTHGGGGGGIASIEKLAGSLKLKPVAPSVVCRGAPDDEARTEALKAGEALARAASGPPRP
jgi:NAD(P)H dehydrogenase (quinone)